MSRRQQVQSINHSAGFLKAAKSGDLEQVLEYLQWNIDVNICNANGLTALHLASKEGHDHIVGELIRRKANVEALSHKGNTPLHIGALGGHVPVVRMLVENGANINAKSQDGFTPLYMAAQENHLDVVKYLLDRNANHTLMTRDGYTPLAVALQLGHDDIVGALVDHDAGGAQSKMKLPPLHRAAKKDDVQMALNLLQNERQGASRVGGGIVHEITKSGFTPLHTAAHYGNTKVGRVLIENGADVDFKARNMVTPLHVASKWGRNGMVQLLLDSGADIACLTKDELTPLHCAARSGYNNVANLLLQQGAQVNAKSKSRLSPLHMSAQGDHVECAELFLARNIPVDDVTIDYLTPLHVTAHCGSVKTCKLLLDRKCEVNARALNGFTPLHIACKKNRIKIIELLLRYRGVIESTTETGLTPLHVASFMGHMSIVKLLLENGANPNNANERGETSLHLAARGDQTEIMAVLLDSGAQVDAKAKELQTALHIAARQGNTEAVDLLLRNGASPNNATKDLYTPLHIAVREGHVDIARMLLDRDANPSLTTKRGFTPLHIAAKHGQLKLAQLLVQRGVAPDIKGRNDLTPLHVATHYDNADIVHYLLNKGASPGPTTKNGYTPLHIAAKKDHADIASTLTERGAKLGCESRNGFTPLHLAAKEGHVRMVKLLFSRGADANCRAKNGLTAMHLAAQEDHVPVAEVLVKNNAQIDPQTKAGYTPLHTACHFGQINMIQFLLEHGASVNATTKVGNTPLHQAAQQGHVMVINLLLRYRANPNAVNESGQTPLSIAQRLGFLSVMETLSEVTEVVVAPNVMAGRYKQANPETMQESTMFELDDATVPRMQSISEEDETEPQYETWGQPGVLRPKRPGQAQNMRHSYQPEDGDVESFRNSMIPGSDTLPMGSFRYSMAEDGQPRSTSPSFRDDADIFGFDKTLDHHGSMSFSCDYHVLEDEMKYMREPMASAVDELTDQYAGTMPMSIARQTKTRAPPPEQFEKAPMQYAKQPEVKTLTRKQPPTDEAVAPPDFLVSFLVDARGGAMEGAKPAGVRIIIPPGALTMPTRITCRLVRVEKLKNPPQLLEGEDLATRILEMGPVGSKFDRPILVDVPHFASLRGRERGILVLRCDDGQTWQEHEAPYDVKESDLLEVVKARFAAVESSDELYRKRINRILTTDLPRYFALVTRLTKDQNVFDSRGGAIISSNSPQVKITVPYGSLTRSTKMGLQIQPISEHIVTKRLSGLATALSPIVTVEPRRRQFNRALTVTMPLPTKGFTKHSYGDSSTLHLLRNSSDGTVAAQWEDITASTPLKFMNDTATFSTTTAASFWLVDCPNASDSARIASELYPEVILVPFMAKFVICGRRHLPSEARLRMFCMTGDVLDKAIKNQGRFRELARSREVEVLNRTPQYLELDGNLEMVKQSKKQPSVFFRALRTNGIPMLVRICNINEDPTGRLAFMRDPKYPGGEGRPVQIPICSMNMTLPLDIVADAPGELEDEELENRIPGDVDSQGNSDESREFSLPISDHGLFPEEKEVLQKKFETCTSDLESEPDMSANHNGRFKRQEPSITELVINTSPVTIDFIPEESAYATFSMPTDNARILTRPKTKEPSLAELVIKTSPVAIDFIPEEMTYATISMPADARILTRPEMTRPETKARKTIDDGTRLVTDVKVNEYKKTDGFTVKERITTTKHVKTTKEVTLIDGLPSDSQTKEELVLTEIEENIVELPPGVMTLLSPDIQTETTEKVLESTLPDGSLVKKKTIRTIGRLKPTAAKRGHRPEEKGSKVTKEVVEGELVSKSKVEESQKTRDDGVTEKLKVVTTQYFRPIAEITYTDGVETDRQTSEKLDNINIEENILELPSGVIAPNADNCDTDISIQTSESTMPDGTPVKKRTVRMIVTLKQIPEKQVSVKRTEGDIRSASQVLTDQENLDSGKKARKRKLITTKHYKPITEVTFTDGVPSEPVMHEEFIGADIDENILELSAGVIEPYAENCDTKISLESCEFPLEEGVPAKKTLVIMTVTPKPITSDIGLSIVEGPIEPRSEARTSEGKLNNGGIVRRKVVTTTFVNPVREVTVVNGVSKSRLVREEVVGVEVVENVLEMPPGITEPNGMNVTTKSTLTKSEETLPNGKVARKKVIRTVAERAEETISYDSKPVPAKRKGKSHTERGNDDIVADNLTHRVIEGEIESRTDVVEDEKKLDAGVLQKRKTVTTRFIKPLYEITLASGMPPECRKTEEVVNAEIRENVLELDYGVVDSNAENCDADIEVTETEVQVSEGVPAKKKTTKITVKLPEDGKRDAADQAKRRRQLPKENRQLIEGDIQLKSTVSEDKQALNDGGTVKRKIITTKHIKPVTEIITKEGRPPQRKEWEEHVATDIEENVLRLPAGVIEPNASNCNLIVSVDKSQVTLPDGKLANKTLTEIVVKLRDPSQPPRERKRKHGPNNETKDGYDDIIEGPVEQRAEVKHYQITRKDGGETLYRVVTMSSFRPIFKVSNLGDKQNRTKLREDLIGIDTVENILELPVGVTDVNRIDVRTDTSVTFTEETLPDGVPFRKRVIRTVGVLLSQVELSSISVQPRTTPDVLLKVIEGDVEPRTETEEGEQNLSDGTTIAEKKITTSYVKPTIEIKIPKGKPPESTAKEEVVKVDVSENILELPCGVIEPYGENCETDISVKESENTRPDDVPVKKKTRRMVVKLIPSSSEKDKDIVPKITKQRIEGEIEHRSSITEDKENLNDGGTVWYKIATTKHIKPITEITSSNGIPADIKRWEELVGTDIEENILQLPAGVIEPNSSNCDIDVNVEKSQVTVPDGSPANKTVTKTTVTLRMATQPQRKKLRKRKWKPGRNVLAKDLPEEEDVIEGPAEARTEVKEFEKKSDNGGLARHREVITTNVKTFLKVSKVGGVDKKTKLREVVESQEIVENILELPPGVTDFNRPDITTSTTVTCSENSLPDGTPVTKKIVQTVASLLEKSQISTMMDDILDVIYKSFEGGIEARVEYEEDEQNLGDGTTIRRNQTTTKYIKPVTHIKLVSGLPPESITSEEVVKAEVDENILELPCGVIDPLGENCATELSVSESNVFLTENIPANKKVTRIKVTLKPSAQKGKESEPKVTKQRVEDEIKHKPFAVEDKPSVQKGEKLKPEITNQRAEDEIEHRPTAVENKPSVQKGKELEPKVTKQKAEEEIKHKPFAVEDKPSVQKGEELKPEITNQRAEDETEHRPTAVENKPSVQKGKELEPKITKQRVEEEIEHRPSAVEDKEELNDGGSIWRKVTTTKHVKPIKEITSLNGIPTDTKRWEELVGTDIEENILQLPDGVIEPNSNNCDIDVNVEKLQVILPDGSPANKVIIRTMVKLRDAFQAPKRKGKTRKWRPRKHGAATEKCKFRPDYEQENVVEGPIESRIDVKEYEVKGSNGGVAKHRVVTTTNVRSIFKVTQKGGNKQKDKLREEVDSKEIVENILELPPGVSSVEQKNVKTDSTVTSIEDTSPEGIPVRKTVVKITATLVDSGELHVETAQPNKTPGVLLKSVVGEIEPRIEVEEDEHNLPDGTTVKRSKITTKYVQPVTDIKLVDGLPPESTTKENVVDADVNETVLELPCGFIESFGENCSTDFSEAISEETLPDNIPAKKKMTKIVVTLRPTGEDGKTKVPKITKNLKEGDVVSRFVMAEERENHDDGSSTQRKIVTMRHFKPFVYITYQEGIPVSTKHWEDLVGVDIEENVLKLPAGVIEPNSSNCDIDISVEKSEIVLSDGNLANKTVTTTIVSLRDPKLPPRQKRQKHKRRPRRKGDRTPSVSEEEQDLIEGPTEQRSEVREYEVKSKDGGLMKYKVLTTISVKPILKVSKVGGNEVKTKVREKLDSKDIVENVLQLPLGVTDVGERGVKTDTTVVSTEYSLPDGVPVTKKTVTTVASMLTEAELVESPVESTDIPGAVCKVIEGEIEPRTEIEEDEQSLNDGTTITRVTITTRYVKPVTEVKLVSGQPPDSTTREEIQGAEVSENILELPCGVIDPYASNCDRDVTVSTSDVVLPEGTPAKKITTRMVVHLRQPTENTMNEEKHKPNTLVKKPGFTPQLSTKVLEGDIESTSETSESQKTMGDGSTVSHRVVTTRYVKPITEIISVDGVPTEEKHRRELLGIDIDETIVQLPVGVIEPNSRNCDVDVTVDKSRVTLPDGTPANKTLTMMTVKRRDPMKPPRENLKRQKWKPTKKHTLKEKANVLSEDTIEGPVESKTEVQEYEVKAKDGGLHKYRIVTTTNVKPIFKVSKMGTVETKAKLREEVTGRDIVENVLELPPGVTDVNQRGVTTDTTLTSTEDTSPDRVPVTKTVVRTVANLLTESDIVTNAELNEIPNSVLKVIEGDIKPKQEVEEEEQNLNDGRTIRQVVVTTKYVRPITEVRFAGDGPPESTTWEEVVGADVSENIFDLPCGIVAPNAANCVQDTVVDKSEVILPDGVHATKKTSKTVIRLQPPGSVPPKPPSNLTDKPSEITRKITEGDIQSKSVTMEDQEILEDGGTQKRQIVTTTYVKPITEELFQDGLTLETSTAEEVVGTDIEETILRLPAGRIEPNAMNCETSLSVDAFEVALPDGSVARKFFALITVRLKDLNDANISLDSKKPIFQTENSSSKNVTEGPVQSRTDSKAFEETSPNGGIATHNSVTTTYFKPIIEITTVNGLEKRNVLKEEVTGLEIVENILELPPGMKEFDGRNAKTDTTVSTSENPLPNGTPVVKRVVKTVVTLPSEPLTTASEAPDVFHKVIDGEIISKSEVVKSQHNLDDGRAIVRKVATTRQVKPVTEIKLSKHRPPESTTREEVISIDVKEHVLELPSGVIEPSGKNCDVNFSVDKTDDLTPENVPVKQRTMTMKVSLRPQVNGKFPQVNHRVIEGDVKVSSTVEEFEESLDDGATAKHKIITTRSVRPITEITSLDGATIETKDREEIISTEIEENILQLPAGVIERNAINCSADLSVVASDVILPDGNLARKTITKVVVQLKKPGAEPEISTKPTKPGEEVRIIDGDVVTKTEVKEDERVTSDGITVKSRVITMTHSRPIIQIVTVNEQEKRTVLREYTTGVDIIENILKLLPGVNDPRDEGVKTTTSIKTYRETLPTGVPVQREIIETLASPLNKELDSAEEANFWPEETQEIPDVTLRIMEGPVEAKSDVKEDQRNLDDGKTIKKKLVTTRYVKPVTEVTMPDNSAPESTTKEELVKGDVKEIILELPCGTIEPCGKNCETDISVENSTVMLPEKHAVPKKIIKMTVHLAEPESPTVCKLPELVEPKVTKKLIEGDVTSNSSAAEDERTLNDGSVVRRKMITTQFFRPVTEVTLVNDEPTESTERVELIDTIIDETVLQLSPGVIEPDASNCETDISFENSEVLLPDGKPAKKRVTRIMVKITEKPEEVDGQQSRTKIVEGPVEQKTKVYKDEKKAEDGSTIRRKVITTRHVRPVLEVVIVNGKETSSHLREEKLVLTEIKENILQLPPGIKDVYGSNVQTKSTANDFEEAASDGSPVKRKVIKTVAYVVEGPEVMRTTAAEGLPADQVIEGPIQSRTTVKEEQRNLNNGVIRKEKVVTTVYFRPFTEVILSETSAPDSQVREEIIRTLIDECILELPSGVIEPLAKNCDTEIKVDNVEYTATNGSPVIKKVVLMIVTLKKEFLTEVARNDTSVRLTGSRRPDTKLIEGEIEQRTKVAEEQENLSSGVTLKRKFITTTYVKPVTEIIFDDSGVEINRNFSEAIVYVDKEEHTLELPCGVIEPYASNCDTDISVTDLKETLPNGIVANKKVVKMTVQLKKTSSTEGDGEKPKRQGKKILEGLVEPRVSVRQKQETKDDGTKVRTKVTTTQYLKSVTEIPVTDGVESEGKTKEVPVSTEIVTDVLELHPSVTEPYSEQATESNVTVKHSEQISADGLPVKTMTKTTIVVPKSLQFSRPVVEEVTHKTVNGDVRSQKSVAEDENDLDDGSTIKRKVITTIYIMPITEITLVNGVETEAATKEKVIRSEIEEHVLQLPAGLIEPHADNCDIDMSVQTFDDQLPDGTPSKKKLVSTVVKLNDSAGTSIQAKKTIEGDLRAVKDVTQNEKVADDGKTIRTRTITTKWLKSVTDVSFIKGIEVKSTTRDVVVRAEIDENILELPPNVNDENRSDLESRTSVEQGEVVLPDGTVAQRKTTRTIVSEPQVDKLPSEIHTTLEGPIESQRVETQDQRSLDDGVTVRRKVVTTRHVKKVTDVTVVSGTPTESKTREVLVGVDIEEHILQLPPGVIEPFGSNCATDITVENSEEDLPEGVTAKKKVVTMIVQLKPQEREISTTSPVHTSKHASLELTLSPEKRAGTLDDVFSMDQLGERTIEKQIEVRKKTAEDRKNFDDGGTLRRKVITSDYVKPIWKVRLVDGKETESFVREEIVNTEIEEHVLQLPPGIIEPFGSNCETDISVENSEVTLSDGRVARKKLVQMIVLLKTSAAAEKRYSVTGAVKPTSTEEEPDGVPKVSHRIEEGQISSLVKVTETQQVLEDGSTVRRKVITTKFIRPVMDMTLVDGIETGTETREENIRTEIEEITLKLPAGVIEPYGSNLETETTVDQFDDTLPDGTPAKKKLVTIVVHLKEPVQPEKRESVSDDKQTHLNKSPVVTSPRPPFTAGGSQVGAAPDLDGSRHKGMEGESSGTVNKVIEGSVSMTTEIDEGENTLEDGTTIRRKVLTTRHFKPITKLTMIDGVVTDAKMDEETIKMEIDENILQLPPGVVDPKGDNLQTDTTVHTSQETLPGGINATRKVTKKVISVKYPLVSKHQRQDISTFETTSTTEEPGRGETRSYETHTFKESAVHQNNADSIDSKPRDSKGQRDDIGKKPQTERVLQKMKEKTDKGNDVGKGRGWKAERQTIPVSKKIRRVSSDGEIVEDELTGEEDEEGLSDADSLSVIDFNDISSPSLISPGDSDIDNSAIKVYTDTLESDPVVERKVEEFEDTLPDGTLVRRRVVRTTQKKTVVKRVVMEGPEDNLTNASEDQAKRLLFHLPGSSEPQLTKYTDVTKEEPESETDVQESEEKMPDGAVVKKRVKTTTRQKLTTERTVLGGTLDDNTLQEIFKEGSMSKALPTAGEDVSKSTKAKDKQFAKPGIKLDEQELSSRLRPGKQIHKKTVVRPGKEETVAINKSPVDYSNDELEQQRDSIGEMIRDLAGHTSDSSGDESL